MPLLAGLFGVIAFSLNDLIVRAIGQQISLWHILLATNTGLLVLTFGWLSARKQGLLPQKFWGWPLVFGLAKAINIICSVMTFRTLPIAEAYLLIFTYPVWVVGIDSLIRRHFLKRYIIPLSLTIVGVFFVYYHDSGFGSGWGVFWGLTTSVLCASSIIMARHLRKESPLKILLSSSMLCLLVAAGGLVWGHIITGPAPTVVASTGAVWLLPLLVLCSASGSVSALYAAQNLPSIRAALLGFLQIPLAVILACALLHETISTRVCIGLVFIIAGSMIAQLKYLGVETSKAASAAPRRMT